MQKNWLKFGLLGLASVALVALVFGAGFFAGRLSGRGVTPAIPLLQRGFLFSGAHGAAGAIEEIQDKSITLKLRDGTTQVIATDNATRVERNLKKANFGDLKVGDRVIVVGAPDPQGKIKARVIRTIDRRAPTPTLKTQ